MSNHTRIYSVSQVTIHTIQDLKRQQLAATYRNENVDKDENDLAEAPHTIHETGHLS
jgi:hypothetical protein